jgi:DNA invertase Pin-like site-specific DNA recombinase
VDTSTPNGRLVFGIFESIAEFERELIRGRLRSGLPAARTKRKRLGRPRLTVDPSDARALRNGGMSLHQIGARLQCSEGPVRRMLAA